MSAACPACGSVIAAGERFCEGCGAELQPGGEVMGCPACGGAVEDDGYCSTCGARGASERDHWREQPASWVAAVCDRGIRHAQNEDALAVAADPDPGGVAVLVVCDGVSSAPGSDVASLAAARAARDVLRGPDHDGVRANGSGAVWDAALVRAAVAGHEAAVAAGPDPVDVTGSASPPSCTFVAAVVDGAEIVTGCVGDSRAYWVPDEGPAVQLTTDDSWAAEAMALGVPRSEAESGPHAHAITRWLGRDSPDVTPSLAQLTATGPGLVVVCSEGVCNYCSEADELAGVVAGVRQTCGSEIAAVAAGLVAWANAQGGNDNISVALARVDPAVPARGGIMVP
jgi:serine/threonine protein phosphatase PrpC